MFNVVDSSSIKQFLTGLARPGGVVLQLLIDGEKVLADYLKYMFLMKSASSTSTICYKLLGWVLSFYYL
jgi:hypothetical protein